MTGKIRNPLLRITMAVAGVLGFLLFMWTPKTGMGILAYIAIFAILVIIAIASTRKRAGYWPRGHDDH
jgi:hypothetical protein